MSEMGVFSSLARRLKAFRPQHDKEKKKTVTDTSLRRAALRGMIHVPPVSICIFLVSANLRGTYIAPRLDYMNWTTTYSLAAFQVAAKFQV